jgi:soluble cytochrome b562
VKTRIAAALSGVALVMAMGSLSGCGNSAAQQMNAWAKKFCDPAAAQFKKINDSYAAISKVPTNSQPATVQKADSAAFQQVSDGFKALAGIVDKAGDLPVTNGAKLRKTTVADLTNVATAYADLKTQVDGLNTKDQAKFAQGLTTVSANADKANKSANQALGNLRTGSVGTAVASQPGCQSTSSGSPSAAASS